MECIISCDNQAGRLEGQCIEEYNLVVDPWAVTLRQTEAGRFDGRLEYVLVNGILVYREHWSRRILATGATPNGYFMLGGTLSPEKRTTWCNQALDSSHLACGRPGSETEFTTPTDGRHAVILIPVDLMRSHFDQDAIETALAPERHSLNSTRTLAATLLSSMNYTIDKYLKHPEQLGDVEECRDMESLLLEQVGTIITHQANATRVPGSGISNSAFYRAIEICEHLNTPIRIPKLAAQVGVSQRTLELAFQKKIGISPRTYMRWVRIRAAYRELIQHDPKTTKVSEVAANWNFFEFGRFAKEYKQLFGESPSETLRKRTSLNPRRISDLL